VLIAFIGMDGSGKTTLAQGTAEALRSQGKKTACLAPFEYIFLDVITSSFKKGKRRSSDCELGSNPLLTRSRKSPLMQFWPCLALIDNWTYFLLRIRPMLSAGMHIVCDRYFYDFATSFEHYGYTNQRMQAIYLQAIPRPHLTFVLDVAPEIACARESGDTHDLEFFLEQRQRYLNIASAFGAKVIDTSKDLQFTQDEVLETILSG
jgi:thymidylate kinase